MKLRWHRLSPAQRKALKYIMAALVIEGMLWSFILLGKGMQQLFWLQWRQAILNMQPMHNVPFALVINQCGQAHNIDPALIAAVIYCESGYNPRALSKAGAVGLMQICLPTWQELKKTQAQWQCLDTREDDMRALYQPHTNIAAGTMYLQSMLLRYRGDPVKALAAYNAGPGSVDRYKGVPPYEETEQYVHRVADKWREYRGINNITTKCYHWGWIFEHTGMKIQWLLLWGGGGVVCAAACSRCNRYRIRRWRQWILSVFK